VEDAATQFPALLLTGARQVGILTYGLAVGALVGDGWSSLDPLSLRR